MILRKGLVDIITDGIKAFYVKTEGSLKRWGGQGDILSGMWGTFSYYAMLSKKSKDPVFETITQDENPLLIAAVASSHFTRVAANIAYTEKKRGLVTPDILKWIELP